MSLVNEHQRALQQGLELKNIYLENALPISFRDGFAVWIDKLWQSHRQSHTTLELRLEYRDPGDTFGTNLVRTLEKPLMSTAAWSAKHMGIVHAIDHQHTTLYIPLDLDTDPDIYDVVTRAKLHAPETVLAVDPALEALVKAACWLNLTQSDGSRTKTYVNMPNDPWRNITKMNVWATG